MGIFSNSLSPISQHAVGAIVASVFVAVLSAVEERADLVHPTLARVTLHPRLLLRRIVHVSHVVSTGGRCQKGDNRTASNWKFKHSTGACLCISSPSFDSYIRKKAIMCTESNVAGLPACGNTVTRASACGVFISIRAIRGACEIAEVQCSAMQCSGVTEPGQLKAQTITPTVCFVIIANSHKPPMYTRKKLVASRWPIVTLLHVIDTNRLQWLKRRSIFLTRSPDNHPRSQPLPLTSQRVWEGKP